jgi:hypothetical protein
MGFSFHPKSAFIVALVLLSACLLPAEADIRAVNRCSYQLTVFYQSQGSGRTQLTLAAGASAQLGLPTPWTGGVLWASQHDNTNNGQCTQLEFTIGPNRDFYDISLVNAYNEPAEINPTSLAGGDTRNGLECGTPSCTIPNLSTVCQDGNYYAGPDNACINIDGTGTTETSSVDLFKNACPQAFAWSTETGVTYACNTGSNYDAIWCP